MRRKELVKLSSPPLQFTFNKKKMKSFEKVKLVLFEDAGALTKKLKKIAESFCHFEFLIYNVVVNLNSGDASFLTIAVADEVPQQKYLTEKTEAIWTTSFKRTAKIEVTERLIRQ